MNVSGMIRGYMSKNMDSEAFLLHVSNAIEHQLQEWDEAFEVYVMKFKHYEIVVKNREDYFHVYLTEEKLNRLQHTSAFSLDRYIWEELQKQGIEIIRGNGNYIDYVFQ